MRWLAIASCAVAVVATALDAGAAGSRGFGGGRTAAAPAHAGPPAHGGVPPHHFHGGGTRVFVGGTFFVGGYPYYYWPGYWPYYGPYYYGPGYYAPVMAAPVVAAPAAYWYYCAPLAAYYPYVPNCPSSWQLVEPYPY